MNAPLPRSVVAVHPLVEALRPRRALTVSEWADAHRVLTPKASAEPGPWRTARTPYLREIMDCLSDRSPVRRVVIMSSAQVGKTEVGLNWIGYTIDHAPAPMLVVVPTLEVRKRWTVQRLAPMLTETPALQARLDARAARDGANTEEIKDFAGGILVIGGANSPASLASMPIEKVLCDEVDRFPWEVGTEGDPLGLIDQRTATFARRKVLLVSTPTVTDASRIEAEWLASDRRRYHVPCPHCGERWPLKWANLRWDQPPTRAWYVCEACGAEVEEWSKPKMLAAGIWVAECPEATTRGYHLNQLYAPIGLGFSWLELAREWLACHEDPAKRKRFTNTVLGESFADRSHEVKPSALAERAEAYELRTVPAAACLITAGVDMQDDRLEVQLVAWGPRETAWTVDWVSLPGTPAKPEVWEMLAELLKRPLSHESGHSIRVSAAAVDTGGHFTADAYAWVRAAAVPGCVVLAIKGSNRPSAQVLSRGKEIDFDWRGRTFKRGVRLYMVGVDSVKGTLFSRLAADRDTDAERHRVRFSSQLEPDYYDQLTSEVFDPEKNRWVKRRGRRNEALDTWVYAYAAAHHPAVGIHRLRSADWERLALRYRLPAPAEAPASPTPVAAGEAAPPGPRALSVQQMIELARQRTAGR